MKLHYSKILLFVLPLNILVTSSSYVHNKNKLYTTPHNTQTNRSLCECDTQSSIYDKDEEMKSVKDNFDRQTSQRFEEYEERMKEKRQKRKEQRDKNIQKIIDKDKMDKSLAQKIEKGCLRCACGLGGVAASVGLFGGLGIYGSKTAAIVDAKAAGDAMGVNTLIHKLIVELGIQDFYNTSLADAITAETYCNADLIANKVNVFYQSLPETELTAQKYMLLYSYKIKPGGQGTRIVLDSTKTFVGEAVEKASKETLRFTANETAAASYNSYSAIGYSVLAILIIALVMIIIYLVLRYRRKKKMKKKAQYTKLLNQ
ncbi:rifin PIR protein, putative [Plasmodium reichenowi]|uniref:Rifin PIR protein, putative n=1 Tax=Plasmodium reichenowi TaxID=5854 RepID=A0A2P9DCG3_PLARE|nr:rifin PIR protein, putative [Plasmodium reichenowi]